MDKNEYISVQKIRKAAKHKGGTGNWLASYKAILPLLLCFFALLIFLRNNEHQEDVEVTPEPFWDKEADEAVAGTAEVESVEAEEDTRLRELYDVLENYLSESGMDESVELVVGEDYIHINFEELPEPDETPRRTEVRSRRE